MQPIRLVVIDDDPEWLRLMMFLLEKQDEYFITAVHSIEEAKDYIRRGECDIVIADLNLASKEESGLGIIDVIAELRLNIPVIAMTGDGQEKSAVDALRAGATNYLSKMQIREELVSVLHSVTLTIDRMNLGSRIHRSMSRLQVKYEFSTDIDLCCPFIEEVRLLLNERTNFTQKQISQMLISTEEALMNSFVHGNLEINSEIRSTQPEKFHEMIRSRMRENPYRTRKVSVELTLTPSFYQATIHDDGPGFVFEEVVDPRTPEHISRPSGRGLLLMKTFMDQVDFQDRGRQVTLSKSLNGNTMRFPAIAMIDSLN